MNQTDEV